MSNKIIIFGVGQYCKKRLCCFEDENVIAFSDNNKNMWGKTINDICIINPMELITLQYDAICIMTGYSKSLEIKQQLIRLGINEEKIYNNDIDYFSKKENKKIVIKSSGNIIKNKIAYFVPNFYNSGGIRAAYYAVSMLMEIYKSITVISPCDGEVRTEFEKKGADIIITPDVSGENELLWNLISECKIIFLNGLYYSYLTPYLSKCDDKKIVWWLHTGASIYKNYPLLCKNSDMNNIEVYGVSNIVQEAYRINSSGGKIGLLPFGIPETPFEKNKKINHEKMIFAIVGAVVPVKGVDVLLKSVNKLSDIEKNKIEIWIIGDEIDSKYAKEMHLLSKGLECVKWLGKKNHEEVMKLYNEIDVLISSSREDMLPIVTIEAFQNSIACIMSDAIGTAGYIISGYHSLVFNSEDEEDLAEKIRTFINNPLLAKEMGTKARTIYEKFFSMDAFKNNLMKVCKVKENESESISSL